LGGFDGGESQRDRLEAIHRNKTAALIRAACRMGVLSASGRDPEGAERAMGPVTAYSEAVGLMFQVVDDLLDVEQSAEQTGKRTRKDAAAGKLTYPGILGVEASRREVRRLLEASLEAVRALGTRASALGDLAVHLAGRSK